MTIRAIVAKCASDPLVPLTTTVYEPGVVDVVVVIVRVEVSVCPDPSVRLVELRDVPGPGWTVVASRVTVPANPLILATLIKDVADDPATIVMLLGFAFVAKSGAVLVLNVAVWTVAGTGVAVPLARLTHMFGVTLVLEQPDWNPTGIPDVVVVML